MVERFIDIEKVIGSSPIPSTKVYNKDTAMKKKEKRSFFPNEILHFILWYFGFPLFILLVSVFYHAISYLQIWGILPSEWLMVETIIFGLFHYIFFDVIFIYLILISGYILFCKLLKLTLHRSIAILFIITSMVIYLFLFGTGIHFPLYTLYEYTYDLLHPVWEVSF